MLTDKHYYYYKLHVLVETIIMTMQNKSSRGQQNHDVLGIVNNLMVRTTNHGLPHIRESKGHIVFLLLLFIGVLYTPLNGYSQRTKFTLADRNFKIRFKY